jgi:NADH-quinone oxidoreductase subunit L
MFLAFLSFTGGLINIPQIFSGNQWLSNFIGIIKLPDGQHQSLEWTTIIVTVFFLSGIIYASYLRYHERKLVPPEENNEHGFAKVLLKKYFVDELYQKVLIKPVSWISDKLYSIVELKIIDAVVEGTGNAVIGMSRVLRLLQSGSVSYYLLFMVIGLVVVLYFNLFF